MRMNPCAFNTRAKGFSLQILLRYPATFHTEKEISNLINDEQSTQLRRKGVEEDAMFLRETDCLSCLRGR